MALSIFMGNPEKVNYVYSDEIKRVLSSKAMLDTSVVCDIAAIEKNPEAFKDTKYIFSTWGMPHFVRRRKRSIVRERIYRKRRKSVFRLGG